MKRRTKPKRTALETQRSADHAKRQREALAMRISGANYDAIAAKLGYANRGGAYKAVTSAIAEITRQPAEELRTIELERLDRMYARASLVIDSLEAADERALDAIRTGLKVIERRAKMLGLDAPTKVDAKLVDTSGLAPEAARSLLLGALEFAKLKAGLT